MDMMQAGLDPAEFAGTAQRAVAACAALEMPARAARLAEDGLLGVLAEEDLGGLGLGLPFAVPVLAAAGAGDLAFPLLETLLLTRALAAPLPEVAATLVAGEAVGSIAWAGTARRTPEGTLVGTVSRAPLAQDAGWLLVRLADGGAALLSRNAAGASITAPRSLDVTVPDATLRLDGAEPEHWLDAGVWEVIEAEAPVLRAALILGAAETCIALTAEHVGNRRQFGKPLLANQAVRHLLARHKLALEGIRGAVTRAAGLPAVDMLARRAAFLAAATHGPLIAEGAIHLHGGMGFTWEVPVHRYLRRIRALEAQGQTARLRDAVAAAIIEGEAA
jgi:alkylation response protein AidB-like acyl-CoA dehydrogenase